MTVERVQVVSQLQWAFRDTVGGPQVNPKTDLTRYGTAITVDPFPAYSHDRDLIARTLDQVTAAFPLPEPFAPIVFLLEYWPHRGVDRPDGIEAIVDFWAKAH